jgi:hypothetical protein
MDISAGRGMAVREFPLDTGFAAYLLYADAKAIGTIEAKPEGHTLTGVEPQSAKYSAGLPAGLPHFHLPLPFAYESTGTVTQFTNLLDPHVDGVNVGYDVYRIETQITKGGATLVKEPGLFVPHRDRRTRKKKYKELDADLTYDANDLDRDVVAMDQIRLVIRTFKERLFTEIFPDRTEVPKTLVFAKTDLHADDIRPESSRGPAFEMADELSYTTKRNYWDNCPTSRPAKCCGTELCCRAPEGKARAGPVLRAAGRACRAERRNGCGLRPHCAGRSSARWRSSFPRHRISAR